MFKPIRTTDIWEAKSATTYLSFPDKTALLKWHKKSLYLYSTTPLLHYVMMRRKGKLPLLHNRHHQRQRRRRRTRCKWNWHIWNSISRYHIIISIFYNTRMGMGKGSDCDSKITVSTIISHLFPAPSLNCRHNNNRLLMTSASIRPPESIKLPKF